MKVEPVSPQDIHGAAVMLAEAFAQDGLAHFFFPGTSEERRKVLTEFFGILLSARAAIGMPVFVSKEARTILGVVMGNDTSDRDWQAEDLKRLEDFGNSHAGLADRFAREEAVVNRFKPSQPHFYLGVLGVHPSAQGMGLGKALIDHFCAQSDTDVVSTGTYIETANPRNVAYYQRLGFKTAGDAELDSATRVWALFRPAVSEASPAPGSLTGPATGSPRA